MNTRTVELFGKQVLVKDYDCMNIHTKESKRYEKDTVNLFIQVTSKCNAHCKFCEWHCNTSDYTFDIDKLARILKEITSKENMEIKKLNFTGGEPTIDIIKFNEIVGCTRDYISLENKPEITVNTNGINLMDLVSYESYIDSIGLSRHHYEDRINAEIFGVGNVADKETIIEFQKKVRNKGLVQLRCNVTTGYIDTYAKVKTYLEHAIEMGVYDCGFVTLLPVNDYCRTHLVDFYKLIDKGAEELLKVNGYIREDDDKVRVCECGNYVYTDFEGHFCKFYNRYFNCSNIVEGQLVYDGRNLRLGFGGEIIY